MPEIWYETTAARQERTEMVGDSARPLLGVVLAVLREDHWPFAVDEKKHVVRSGYRGEHGTWVCYITVDEEEQRLSVSTLMGMNIPAVARQDVVDYLNRVNLVLVIGHFEMDPDTGSVCFRAGVETPGSEMSPAMARRLFRGCVSAMDLYFPGLLAIVHGGLSPVAALARASSRPTEWALDR